MSVKLGNITKHSIICELNRIMHVTSKGWIGQFFMCERKLYKTMLKTYTDELTKPGVYWLLSDNAVYIGKTHNLTDRILRHVNNKVFWHTIFIFTTTDNSLTAEHISYMEHRLITIAKDIGNYSIAENKNTPKKPHLDKLNEIETENLIDYIIYFDANEFRNFLFSKQIVQGIFVPFRGNVLPVLSLDEDTVRYQFWEGLYQYSQNNFPIEQHINRKPNIRRYVDLAVSGRQYCIQIKYNIKDKKLMCGVWINNNKQLYDDYYNDKSRIEGIMGTLNWDRKADNIQGSYIYLEFDYVDDITAYKCIINTIALLQTVFV